VLRLHEFGFNPIRAMILSIQVYMLMSKKVRYQVYGLQYMMVHDIFNANTQDFVGGRAESSSLLHPAPGYRYIGDRLPLRAGEYGGSVRRQLTGLITDGG
jgi:hypothetical protein